MPKYDNDMTGALFKNDKKEKPNHPDYRGKCEIGGIEFWVSAWLKDGKSGKFMSLAFTAKEEEKKPQAKKTGIRPTADDDIPF